MDPVPAPDFGPLARDYDRLRPADEGWHELAELVVAAGDLAGRRVLDVGCGTGRLGGLLAGRGARVWGVDASAEMVAVARERLGRAVGLRRGNAEALPFKDGWFDRAVMRLVVHLVDRRRALPEVARVLAPGGRVVVATFDHEHFARSWLAPYFPSLEAIDRARFPPVDGLVAELEEAGFVDAAVHALVQHETVARDDALERIRGRHISTLRVIPADELAAGTTRAERELPETVASELHWAVVTAERA